MFYYSNSKMSKRRKRKRERRMKIQWRELMVQKFKWFKNLVDSSKFKCYLCPLYTRVWILDHLRERKCKGIQLL